MLPRSTKEIVAMVMLIFAAPFVMPKHFFASLHNMEDDEDYHPGSFGRTTLAGDHIFSPQKFTDICRHRFP